MSAIWLQEKCHGAVICAAYSRRQQLPRYLSMRIAIISDVYFPRVNGVSTSIRTFRRELMALGHEVFLIAPDYGEPTDDESWILRVPSRVVYVDPEDRMMRFSAVMRLESELRQLNLDLLHIQTPFVAHYAGVKLAKRLRIPVVLTYHTYFEEYLFYYVRFLPRFFLRWIVRHLTRQQCSQVDSVVVPTQAFSQVLRDYGVRSELYINPTGIDLKRFSHGDGMRFREENGIPLERPALLFVGRMVHEKNIDFLLRVVQRVKQHVPEIMMMMVGEGPAEAHLRELGQELGIEENLQWIGNLNSLETLCDCYCAGDIFIFASRTETQGLVLLEAMALGVPVVSTARMGTVDILKDCEGARVVDEDEAAFTAAILELLADGTLRKQLGRLGQEHARTWSAQALALRLEEVYMETVESTYLFGREIEGGETP